MEKKSGVSETDVSLPSGGGALKSIGDSFQPNLAMGGGSYKIPIDVPQGPGGFSPKIELLYNTGFGNGPFGAGWVFAVPFIGQRQKPLFAPPGEPEYTVSDSETLVPAPDGSFVPFIQQELQSFRIEGDHWISRSPNLVDMRFGASESSRVQGGNFVARWLLDRVTFPANRTIDFEYDSDNTQRYLRRIRWSVFRLEFTYENRPDPFSTFDDGFEIRTARRCTSIELHHDRLAPNTLVRRFTFEYTQAPRIQSSLLQRVRVSGFRQIDGATHEAKLPPLTFGYTGFDPAAQSIRRFQSNTVPPPLFHDDATLFDYRGSSLAGILRLNGGEATYWENRGNLIWGPPERLRGLPQGVHLSDDGVRFADLTGNGTADIIISSDQGRGYFPNDPEQGFLPKRQMRLAPSFEFGEEGSFVFDLDGNRISDYITFRNGAAMAFFNNGGESWTGPVVLPQTNLPNLTQLGTRLRLADMNGDGLSDLVLLRSRQVTYWPSLGKGRFGPARTIAHTPSFDVPNPDTDVLLADIDGDGSSDLILLGAGEVRIYLNRTGESFADPIILRRTPRFNVDQFLLADMTGSGTTGFFWSTSTGAAPHEYWFLDPLNGVKPYLLQSIDNGMGQTTTIEYSTSAFERAADLADGQRWSGHLPFVVHLVKRMTARDNVTGIVATTEYRYHDGHYDGHAREYVGFACVESRQVGTDQLDTVHQRLYFHNRGVSADDPQFIAGKGQPHRTELLDPASDEVRQVDESEWKALPVPTSSPDRPAYLAVESRRTSRRFQGGVVYEREQIAFDRNANGSITREHRRGEWHDSTNQLHTDELIIGHEFTTHAMRGLTSIPCLMSKSDGAGRTLKHIRFYYDGPDFTGLPFGTVANGFRSRQTEVCLTQQEINAAYAGVAPALLNSLYRSENVPGLGQVFVKDTRRYRVDIAGNQVETIDALDHHVIINYDADRVMPVSMVEDGRPPGAFEHDPICQQPTRIADLNGNILEQRYDAFGNVLAVFRRGAPPDKPSETYEYHTDTVPNFSVQRLRVNLDDAQPGWTKFEYRDGSNRPCLTKSLAEDGRWAAAKQNITHPNGIVLVEREAWFSNNSNFEPLPSSLAEKRSYYDFARRLKRERHFNGKDSLYAYEANVISFYGPERAAQFLSDPTTRPTRVSRKNAWGQIISIVEFDNAASYEQRRDFDALSRLSRITGPAGNVELESVFDLWGNRIRVMSADCGVTTYIYDAGNNEILRTDAAGNSSYFPRDERGRALEVRQEGPGGTLEESYTYDSGPGSNLRGRLAMVTGAFGSVAYSYSMEGDPVRITRAFPGNPQSFVTQFTYNAQKQVTSVTYPDNTRVQYQYHATGTLRSIPGYINTIEYTASGRRGRIDFANGITTTRGWSHGDDSLLELRTARAGVDYQRLVYSLDPIGQVTRIDDGSTVPGKIRNNQTFTYDGRNRLIRGTGRGAGADYDFAYRYDSLGNLIFSGESFAVDMDYGLQTGDLIHPNRLIKRKSQAAAEYEYDACGNLTREPEMGRLFYDRRQRLVRVERPDGAVIEYRYDHNNRRTETHVTRNGSTTVQLEVDGLYLVEDGRTIKVVVDEEHRLAVVPSAGSPLLHHLDRLGNVNVVSNLQTGAFVGNDEYTPYGRLSVSMVIQPHYQFQGTRFTDGVDASLLGARYYCPRLGRFLTPDRYLALNQEKITAFLAATNLYLYALANPANFTDPTGQIAFLVVLAIAAIVGAVLGAIGAAVNGVKTWDEFLLWIIGGAIGAVIGTLFWAVIGIAFGLSAVTAAIVGLVIWGTASFLATILTPALDATNSEVAWGFSFALKLITSPVLTILGLIVAAFAAMGGSRVDFRRGMLFVEVGSGGGALTLGAIAWTHPDEFDSSGHVSDSLARHESFHSKTVATIGEWGFYLTYLTVGAIWGAAQGGAWNDLNSSGCGQPFEKTAHTYTGDPATAVSASSC